LDCAPLKVLGSVISNVNLGWLICLFERKEKNLSIEFVRWQKYVIAHLLVVVFSRL